jgi:hypothetical protein
VALLSGGCAIHVSTDHAPLTQLQSQPHISRRQARWLEFLSSFRPNVVYVQGRMNPADILSRPPHVPRAAFIARLGPRQWRHLCATGLVTAPAGNCQRRRLLKARTRTISQRRRLAPCTCWTRAAGGKGAPEPSVHDSFE